MTDLQKPVGATTTLTAVVTNKDGVVLADAAVTWQTTVGTVTEPTPDTQHAEFIGDAVEIVTFTATTDNGFVSPPVNVDYVDNVPAAVTVIAA